MQTENTTILSQNIRLNLDETDLNNNVLVIGGSGTGKTIGFVYPNLMQANTNYIVTDFRKDLYETHADSLRQKGYNVMLIDFENMTGSHYNPLHYINKDNFKEMEQDILGIINVICANTNDKNCEKGDPYWMQTEQLIFATLLLHCVLKHKKNVSFKDVFKLYDSIMDDNGDVFTNLMNEIREIYPDSTIINATTLHQKHFRGAVTSIGWRLESLRMYYERERYIKEYKNNPWRNYYDALNLEAFGSKKNIIFVTDSVYNSTMRPLVSLFIWQASNILMKHKNERITRLMLDECQNIGYIPELVDYLSNAAIHNVSYNIMIQSFDQLKNLYPNEWQQIITACDSMLVCGYCSNDDVCYISQLTGQTAISDPLAMSYAMKQKSNFIQKLFSKRKTEPKTTLRTVSNMRPEEIQRMDRNQCLVLQKGCDAKLDEKCQDGWILLQKIYEEKRKKKE